MSQQQSIADADIDSRYQFFLQQAVAEQEVWILTDEQGAVILSNDDEEECLPVWPDSESAEHWASEEWSHCEAEPISLKVWQHRWVDGLTEDGLLVIVYPGKAGDGMVIEPFELDKELRRTIKEANKG